MKTGGNDVFRRRDVGQRRVMCQARTGQGVFWGGDDGQEGFGWVQLTLTFFLDFSWYEVFIFSWVTGVARSLTTLEPCSFPVTSVLRRAHSGLLRAPEDPCIYPSPGGLTLMLYEVSKSLPQAMVALGKT